MNQNYFTWDANPEIFSLDLGGFHFAPRWYGLLFATGILLGFHIMRGFYRKAGKSEEVLNSGFILFVLGTVFGARIGHCLFYEPEYYLSQPWKILAIWEGGLASHGGLIGIFLCMIYYTRKYKIDFMWLADRLAFAISAGVGFIRVGNFFNSEIVGHPTDVPWAVIFKRYENGDAPRHAAQLYEALAYFVLALGLWAYNKVSKGQWQEGKPLGFMLIWIFTARFFIEFLKENQVAFEQGMALNMGQLLSIPVVALGVFFYVGGYKKVFGAKAAEAAKLQGKKKHKRH
jgi:phosphatidylglycerol:prolipoprotein diacylglycerol transferase